MIFSSNYSSTSFRVCPYQPSTEKNSSVLNEEGLSRSVFRFETDSKLDLAQDLG